MLEQLTPVTMLQKEGTTKFDSVPAWMLYDQACQNDSRFEISPDCVVIGSRFHIAKSAPNDNKIGVNLKTGVIPTGLTIIDGLLKNKFQSCIVQLMLCDTRGIMSPFDNLILQDKV